MATCKTCGKAMLTERPHAHRRYPKHPECPCPCHNVIQTGLVPCPQCARKFRTEPNHSSRYGAGPA